MAIKFVSNQYPPADGDPPGMSISGLPYSTVLGYAMSERCQIIEQVNTYVKFSVVLQEVAYEVTLSKIHDTGESIITSTTALQRLRHWLGNCVVPTEVANKSDIELLGINELALGDTLDASLIWQEDSAFLPEEINVLNKLSYLGLQYKGIYSLPQSIGDISSLEILKLGGNHLKTLPVEIGKLRKLRILTAWQNELTSIPEEIGLLSGLEGLDLSLNPLLTMLPDEIVMLTNLKRLYLSNETTLSPRQVRWIAGLREKGCEYGMYSFS